VPDSIAILLGMGVESRMKRWRHLGGSQDAHGGRQMIVQCADNGRSIDVALQGDVRDLTTGMNARIRPTGTNDCNGLSFEQPEGLLEQFLDRRTRRLPLPSDELRSVVRERQLISSHLTRRPGASLASPRAILSHTTGRHRVRKPANRYQG